MQRAEGPGAASRVAASRAAGPVGAAVTAVVALSVRDCGSHNALRLLQRNCRSGVRAGRAGSGLR